MKIRWVKLARCQMQAFYLGWTASIEPIGNKMYHYDIYDPKGKHYYTGEKKYFFRAKRRVKILLKSEGEYLNLW